MTETVRIGVVGVGLIGRRHVAAITAARSAALASVADPSDGAGDLARREGVPHHPDLAAMLSAGDVDGVILATPNQAHVEGALACIEAGIPVLVEKPLAADVAGGREIALRARAAGIPVLVGHHRRHNPIIRKAHGLIAEGRLGRLTTIHATTWFRKPDDYFDVDWRRREGGGPIYINLIHDLDLIQHFAGPIAEVHAFQSNATRGFDVEDTAVVSLRFASGTLGTVNLSDATTAPWSWELTAGENSAYPATPESAYLIGGTDASLALPNLALWSHEGGASWWRPISATRMPIDSADPLIRQIEHFAAVIRGDETPLVPAEDGLAAVSAVEAVKRSANLGAAVRLDEMGR